MDAQPAILSTSRDYRARAPMYTAAAAALLAAFSWHSISVAQETEAEAESAVPAVDAPIGSPDETAGEGDSPPQVAARPDSRLEARAEYDRLLEEEDLEGAIEMAELLVELTEMQFGERSIETAEALILLGQTQQLATNYDAAEISLLASIDIYRQIEGLYSGAMVEPLTDLGDNYFDAEQFENAVAAYSEARTVHRRVYGLLSTEQMELIDKTTAALEKVNLLEEAETQQLAALTITERVYEPGSQEVIQALYKYAEWLMGVNRFDDARIQFGRAVAMIEEYHGETSILLVEAYRRQAASYREQGVPQVRGSIGMTALRKALEVLELQEDPDALILAGVLLDLGDAQIAGNGNGTSYYLRAWDALEPLDNADELRKEWFAPNSATFITKEPISNFGLSFSRLATQGSVTIVFDVDDLGRPYNEAVAESDPPGFKDAAALRALRQSRFRPRIENRQVVPALRMRVEYSFRYLPEELD